MSEHGLLCGGFFNCLDRVDLVFLAVFFEAFASSSNVLLEESQTFGIVLVKAKCAAPEAAVDVGRLVAVDDLCLARKVNRRNPR